MPFVEIDPELNKSEEIATFLQSLITTDVTYTRDLTVYEILAQKSRTGLNPDILANSIISRFKEIGIPSGPLVNGATNVMEAFVLIICEEIVDAIQNDMRVDLGIFAGGTIQATGANSGGPVASTGSVMKPQEGIGIAR